MLTKEAAYNKIKLLTEKFADQLPNYKRSDYNETLTRKDFIDPFFPELVTHVEDKERDVEQYLMDYSGFGVIAIKGIQELQQVVKEKEETIDALKNRVEKLEATMETLQQNFEKCNPCMQTSATNSQVSGIQQRETINQKRETVLLEQNIPNPFNYSTTINYTLPQQYSSTQIIITDKSGKLLKQVNISGNGNGSIKVDASALASGAYQYSLYVDGKLMDTKQMVLTK